MGTLVFATHNSNKAEEIRAALGGSWQIRTLKDAGIETEIPEPHDTLEENAREKSLTIQRLTGTDCFSEDTGLEVEALGGEPGVNSARYAGEERNFFENMLKLLSRLSGQENRKARFRTVISYRRGEKEYQFEGICPGSITTEMRGEGGFGYDPVFVPEGDTRTFAEMTMEEKNRYSHRKKAMDALIDFLQGVEPGIE